jgi:arylsulfatase A
MKLRYVTAGLGGILLLPSCIPSDNKSESPNIIFILADDLGYGDISYLNPDSRIKTPNIDGIASSGLVFTDAHSGSAVSTPTRYGILTGRYSWRSELKSGVLDGYSKALIKLERTTIASMLKEKGYQTACFGKWHLGWDWNNIDKGIDSIDFSKPVKNSPSTRGFDYFYGISASLDMPPYIYLENDQPTSIPDRLTTGNNSPAGSPDYDGSFWREGPTGSDFDHSECTPNLTKRACKYIEDCSSTNKPFFIYLAYPSPHTPILPSKAFQGKSGLNQYADFVMMVDSEVGKILNTIKQGGNKENTIVVFASDNGCSPWADFEKLNSEGHFPSYIFRGYKADLYDGGHRIPCMIQWPARVKKKMEVDQIVCLNDFMATFADIIGYPLSDNEGEDSYSLLPLIEGKKNKRIIREIVVHHSINGNFSIRNQEWKLLLSPGSGGWSSPKPGKEEEGLPLVQLYNINSDPGETVNLQDKYPEIVSELKGILKKYIEEGRSTPGKPQKNDGEYPWEQIKEILR